MSVFAFEDVGITPGTGAGGSKHGPPMPCLTQPMAPMGLVIPGGMTSVASCRFPFDLLDATSADVIELPTPWLVLNESGIDVIEQSETEVQRLVDRVKRRSGLTWGQVAEAMGLDQPRAIHLWRSGGGISAANERRLNELNGLIDSIDLGSAADVRAELLQSSTAGSILDRLHAGESPLELSATAPWRLSAREALTRNFEASKRNDGILDEDFLFLLELDDEGVARFDAEAEAILDDTSSRRRDWEELIDAQFGSLTSPPAPAPLREDEGGGDDDPEEMEPLFRTSELGIELGVGAIAAGRGYREGQ
ncbi:MAG: hypothetical protein ACRDQ2_11215 [Gaiellales bacterium]